MEITIKDTTYTIKYTLRAMFIFEQITGKMFDIKTVTDEYIFFYCLLLANNQDMTLTFNDLIDELDNDPTIMKKYNEFIVKEMNVQKLFMDDDTDKKKKE